MTKQLISKVTLRTGDFWKHFQMKKEAFGENWWNSKGLGI